jgi:hypothetical protein
MMAVSRVHAAQHGAEQYQQPTALHVSTYPTKSAVAK